MRDTQYTDWEGAITSALFKTIYIISKPAKVNLSSQLNQIKLFTFSTRIVLLY